MDNITAGKYRLIREQQLREIEEGVDLIDDRSLPLLPEWREQLEQLKALQEADVKLSKETMPESYND